MKLNFETMNALSLWQPWASAIAVGVKTIETRSWAAPASAIGKRIAIAAAQKDTRALHDHWLALLYTPTGTSVHHTARRLFVRAGFPDFDSLPRGCVVCTAKLVACKQTDGTDLERLAVGALNAAWGDYTAGRFAWVLEDVKPLRRPVPVVGHQKLFSWSRK